MILVLFLPVILLLLLVMFVCSPDLALVVMICCPDLRSDLDSSVALAHDPYAALAHNPCAFLAMILLLLLPHDPFATL